MTFPELYVPGYTMDPDGARDLSEPMDGPSITKAREIAGDNAIGLIVPYGERYLGKDGKEYFFDSIAFINEKGELLDSYLNFMAERILNQTIFI